MTRLLITLFSFVIITGFTCRKDEFLTGCLKGIVVDNYCANIIIQVTEGNYDPSLVNQTWEDPLTGMTYNNVFTVRNYCEVQADGIQDGQTISFRIGEEGLNNSCVTCMGIRPTPSRQNIVKMNQCP